MRGSSIPLSFPAAIGIAPREPADPPADFDWAAFGDAVGAFYEAWRIPIDVVLILVGAMLIRAALHFVVRRVVNRVVNGMKRRQGVDDTQALLGSPLTAVRVVQRTRTLGSVLSNIVTVLVVIVAAILVVNAIDANATGAFALITAALGAGLGFGAQNIVKDVLNGLFMVGEDQLGIGDVVDLGEASGVVEVVGIRVTQVRDVSGTLWYVRNGEILRVGNKSQGWARVILDLPVPYNADVAAVEHTVLETAKHMAEDPVWARKVLESPEIWGIESVSAEALVTRLVMKTRTADQWDVARELRRRVKLALDEIGVSVPALNRMVVDGLAPRRGRNGAAPEEAADGDGQEPEDGGGELERVARPRSKGGSA